MEEDNKREVNALIRLLDEPDELMFGQIREKLISFGTDVIPSLEEAWENAFDPALQSRVEDIIGKIQYETLYFQLNHWATFLSHDLLKGFYLVSTYQYPDLKEDSIRNQVDEIIRSAWLEINTDLTALENVKVLNHILFEYQKFSGNRTNLHAPQNSFVNTLLETKKGSPLSLGILYIILAQRLHIPVYGVNLPQHFVLAYTREITEEKMKEENVLFYINPFSKGSVFSRFELEMFIRQLKIEAKPYFFLPCSHNDMIRRLINNLAFSYRKLGHTEKVKDLEGLLPALE